MLIATCAALVLLMLLWPMETKNTENEAPETVELTAGDYTRALSAQIAQMVSAITGESEPQVTVTLRTMGETVYATEDKQSEKSAEEYSGESLNRTQTDGDTQKTYILVKAADGSEAAHRDENGAGDPRRGSCEPRGRRPENAGEECGGREDCARFILYAGMRGGVQRIYIWQRMKPFSEDRRNTE